MAFISINQQTNNRTPIVDPNQNIPFNGMPELQKYMNQIIDLHRSNIQNASREEQQKFVKMNENEKNIYLRTMAEKQISLLAIKIVQSNEEQRKVYRNAILNASKSIDADKIMQEFIVLGETNISKGNLKTENEKEQQELAKLTKADLLNPEKKALALRGIEKYNESLPEKRREIIKLSIISLMLTVSTIILAIRANPNDPDLLSTIFYKISIAFCAGLPGIIYGVIPLIKAIKRLIKESHNIERLELILQELENSQNINAVAEPAEESFDGGLGI